MSNDKNNRSPFSRRDLLKCAGLVAVGATLPGADAVTAEAGAPLASSSQEAFEILTAEESDTLEAIVARLIPTDETGPGAAEARAVHYIDRALGGALSSSRELYASGLQAVNAYARTSKGSSFRELTPEDQDAVLADMESGVASGFGSSASGSARAFFDLVLGHTIEGTFSDPYYGGNANFVGWDLIGYPGVRTRVSVEDQRMDVKPEPNHRSAYDYPMFTKRGG